MNFLLYLSAQTPAKREINICGTKVHKTSNVINVPDEYFNVIYHKMEKFTTDEPNVDTV